MSLADLLDPVETMCRRAGTEIMRVFQGALDVRQKSDQSPVTAADLAAHEVLATGLPGLLQVPMLSEEGEIPTLAARASWQRYWLVDPLDGTRQFIRGSEDFSVNVALIENGRPVLGLVYLPAHNLCYRAALGAGAHSKRGDEPRRPIAAVTAGETLRIVVSSARSGSRQQALIQKLEPADVLLKGSSWKSCLVADGSADLYPRFGPTCEWDTAAAQCIVEQAGAFMVTEKLQPLRYNRAESLINPNFFVFGDPSTGRALSAVLPDLP